MLTSKKNIKLLRDNSRQLLFVIVAFLVMILSSVYFISGIMQDHLFTSAENSLEASEANITLGLSEATTLFMDPYNKVQSLVSENAGTEEIRAYLSDTADRLQNRSGGTIVITGIYAYINGTFVGSVDLNPTTDFIPQLRPWYQTAIRSKSSGVVYTPPYIDVKTGEFIVTATKNIVNANGENIGILAMDIKTEWFEKQIGSISLSQGGYGILLSQNMTFVSYPDLAYLGKQLHELSPAYREIEQALRRGEEIHAVPVDDKLGNKAIFFIRKMPNGWHVGIVTPWSSFYHDLYMAAAALIVLGIISAAILCLFLLKLAASKMQSDEESRYKSSFLAQMSHEIRTPMNAVVGLTELALHEKNPPETNQYLGDIKLASYSLLAIINDILDFSKIESGKLELAPAEYSVYSLISDVMVITRTKLNEKHIKLTVQTEGVIPACLYGDEGRIRQILLNILSNAVKYTEKGSITFTIAQTEQPAIQADSTVKLKFSVEDTGVGIKEENLNDLFEDFKRIPNEGIRNIEGTGLGLAIAKHLCEMMDGKISVSSIYGQGSVFTVTIPQKTLNDEEYVLPAAESTPQENHQEGKYTPTSFRAPGASILVVDDNDINLTIAVSLLEFYQIKADEATGGIDAVNKTGLKHYDLIFMDHMMPDMDGIKATAAIRERERADRQDPAIIIALTANAIKDMRQVFIDNGFDDFLSKPIEVEKLDKMLDKWLPDDKKTPLAD